MHSVDKKLVKNRLGSVEIEGKKYDIFKPSLQQILTHTVESEEYNEKLKSLLEDENNALAIVRMRYAWLMREVEIFIPQMDKDAVGNLDEDMRKDIFAIIWPEEPNGDAEAKSSGGKKKG